MYSILNMPDKKYKKQLLLLLSGTIGVVVIAFVVSILLAVFRTDATHTVFLAVIIVVDILAAWTVITLLYFLLLPKYKIYRLYKKSLSSGERVSGELTEKGDSQRYDKLDCVTFCLETDEGIRRVFFPEEKFGKKINIGDFVTLTVVDNIVCNLEVDDEK